MFNKKIFFFIVQIFLCNAFQACPPKGNRNSTDSITIEDFLNTVPQSSLVNAFDTFENKLNEDFNVFVLNVGQGNFIVLKYKKNIAIVDAGVAYNIMPFQNFWNKHSKILSKIFDNTSIKAVVITHPDKDHYNYIPELLTQYKKEDEDVTFFLSRNSESDYQSPKISFGPDNVYVVNSSNDKICSNELLTLLFGIEIAKNASISFLVPLTKIENSVNNDISLILKITYHNQSILFTGDATGKTFEAIVGDSKNNENREILSGTNVLVAPHHGSISDGSLLWLMHITSKNPYNFAGAIFCAPLGINKGNDLLTKEESKQDYFAQKDFYSHPNYYIDKINYENKTFDHKIIYHHNVGQGSNPSKEKTTKNPIFITSCVEHAYWLNFSKETGMQIFNDSNEEFYPLVSPQGWTMSNQKLIDGFKGKDETIFHATMARFFQTPEILQCQCSTGTKLEAVLTSRTEKTIYSKDILKLFQFFVNLNATVDDLKQWWKSKTSLVVRKRSSSCLGD